MNKRNLCWQRNTSTSTLCSQESPTFNQTARSISGGSSINTPLYNYNEFIKVNWEEVTFHLTVDSDWKKAQELIKEEVNAYVADFTAQLTEKEIQKITRKSALFDEELKLKSYVLINDATIEIITQFPIEYIKGTSTKSLLNEKIIPKLQNTSNIELSGKTLYMHVNNLQDLKNHPSY